MHVDLTMPHYLTPRPDDRPATECDWCGRDGDEPLPIYRFRPYGALPGLPARGRFHPACAEALQNSGYEVAASDPEMGR